MQLTDFLLRLKDFNLELGYIVVLPLDYLLLLLHTNFRLLKLNSHLFQVSILLLLASLLTLIHLFTSTDIVILFLL